MTITYANDERQLFFKCAKKSKEKLQVYEFFSVHTSKGKIESAQRGGKCGVSWWKR